MTTKARKYVRKKENGKKESVRPHLIQSLDLQINAITQPVCWSTLQSTVTDPGFPVGGRGPRRGGGVDSRGGYVSKILYVETKESRPLGGTCTGHAPPP